MNPIGLRTRGFRLTPPFLKPPATEGEFAQRRLLNLAPVLAIVHSGQLPTRSGIFHENIPSRSASAFHSHFVAVRSPLRRSQVPPLPLARLNVRDPFINVAPIPHQMLFAIAR